MKGYPIVLVHLDRARCLVVGGGVVAARKVAGLQAVDARITVISPDLCPDLQDLATRGEIDIVRRAYQEGDLEGAFLVIAATDDPVVNQQIWEEAQARNILVNVVDNPDCCTFIAPAVARRGSLTLAISTAGRSPALARHLRQRLEQEFGPPYGPFVELLGELRARTLAELPLPRHQAFWDQIFRSDVLDLLASGDDAGARRCAENILAAHLSGDV